MEDSLALEKAKEYIITNTENLPYNLAGDFVELCYPNYLDKDELIKFVKKSESNWNESWRSIPQVLYDIAEHNWFNISGDKLEDLLEVLVIIVKDKLQSSNKDERFRTINIHYREISGAISSLLRRELSSKIEIQLRIDVLADAVKILRVYHKHFGDYLLEKVKVKELISKFSTLKRELFYRRIQHEKSKGLEVKYLYNLQYFFDDFWYLGKNDINWLIGDLIQATDLSNKHVLLDSILHLLRDENASIERYEEIKSIIDTDEDLTKHYIDFMSPPKPRPDKFMAKIERDEKKLKHQQEIQLDENKKYLLDHLDSLRKGKELNTLHYLVEKMAAKGSRNSWGQNNLKAIEDMFGIEVKHAAKEGFKVFWRSWSPPLPHEIEDRNKTEYGVIIGLSGIAIEISDKFDVTAFSEVDAELATRYATREINNFPSWLKDIAVVFPDAVKKILNVCIESEFNTPKEKPIPHEVLATLVHAEILLKELASQKIYDLIKTETPDHLINVSYALSILLNSSLKDSGKVNKLIGNKTNNIKNDVDAFIVWFDAWLNLDFTNAVNYLEKKLKKLNAKESYDLMVNLCGELSRSRHYSYFISFDLGKINEIKSLVKFLRLVYKHIKQENDSVYFGGYTPDVRDDAQHFRGRLLDRLLSIPGKESYNALISLSKESDLVSSRDVFQYLAKGKAEKELESEVWRPQDVAQFYSKFTKEIISDEELFYYTLEKIDEIKDHIEKGDVSTRGLFNSKTKESEFQKWIADRLRLIGTGNYSVTREEEVDDLKKPDLRIRKNNFIVGIEIKIANEYSVQELSRAISNQLINSYLKDINSKYGIFLLINVADKKWSHPKTSKRLDINQVTKYLSDYADKLNSKNQKGKKVQVININFVNMV
ncbi:MAG: hypothetical protein A2315_09525 [Ignavibacteria bacterium RIFOXYB2_FULL_35_12]|nr:MAG: hypothetical protein A2058_14045 [Ignavibacteria bacterium GWA2_36_19]OGU55484.1 MAG: hypothetical protein A2006_08470 [Ignavibacteria bacterium GWC2_35_8]OGU62523.1 MAG: hypothetical protein A2X60_18050 [Ignavibacteria bacterium GWF2_35_20]OGU87581.1 MAG: hypothetical protein A3K31_03695 [Ignavibacteria bacterium RIFOXYA12_FULL_35_25]OGU88012.1 MAG: hypothetical protein A2492_13605 [Ignavibacteria bacterium RIFOXYC12_FULL_35_11]OGU96152.1 MAG: hypothetical protein A2347_04040 [Ignavib